MDSVLTVNKCCWKLPPFLDVTVSLLAEGLKVIRRDMSFQAARDVSSLLIGQQSSEDNGMCRSGLGFRV